MKRALIWTGAAAAAGLALSLLYPDSYQQDGGIRFLMARWAWVHPDAFVSVWGRPLFMLAYSIPAQAGFWAAKLFTVAIGLATAWQTWRIAGEQGRERADLVIPLVILQPSFFLLFADTLTEPLFALVLAVALRLHLRGQVTSGMAVASLLVLARPEGAFVAALWAAWTWKTHWRRLPLLLAGGAAWWLAAWLLTGDPLHVIHDWPRDWSLSRATYGSGPVWAYLVMLIEIAGPVLVIPLVMGLQRAWKSPSGQLFLLLFVLHTVLWVSGRLGSAGYPRYFVSIAPAIALLMHEGINRIAERRMALVWTGLAISAAFAPLYVDGHVWLRDAGPIKEMVASAKDVPARQVAWSHAYVGILLDRDPRARLPFGPDRDANLRMVRAANAGTLIFWDDDLGPRLHGLTASDIEAAGYRKLRETSHELAGRFMRRGWFGYGGPRKQRFIVLYRE